MFQLWSKQVFQVRSCEGGWRGGVGGVWVHQLCFPTLLSSDLLRIVLSLQWQCVPAPVSGKCCETSIQTMLTRGLSASELQGLLLFNWVSPWNTDFWGCYPWIQSANSRTLSKSSQEFPPGSFSASVRENSITCLGSTRAVRLLWHYKLLRCWCLETGLLGFLIGTISYRAGAIIAEYAMAWADPGNTGSRYCYSSGWLLMSVGSEGCASLIRKEFSF